MLHVPNSLQVCKQHTASQLCPGSTKPWPNSSFTLTNTHRQGVGNLLWRYFCGDIYIGRMLSKKNGRKKIQILQTLEDFVTCICKEHMVPHSGDMPLILLLLLFLYIFLLCNQPNYLFIWIPRLPT